MTSYTRPASRLHKGFMYLDDEIVTNSLSAIEAGKIDEVVAKISSARDSSLSGGTNIRVAKVDGERHSTSALEEEIVRKRTRFSIFEIWLGILRSGKHIGSFKGWGETAIADVEAGDTVQLNGEIEMQPFQTLIRLYLWYAEQARIPGSIFALPAKEHKELKDTSQMMKSLLGPNKDVVFVDVTPVGALGPTVSMALESRWAIEPLGRLSGTYTIIGQVEKIVNEGDEFPAVRVTDDVPPTLLELTTLADALSHFKENADQFGVGDPSAVIHGPAMILRPIAVYR